MLKIVIFKYTRKQTIYVANGYGSLRLSDSTFLSYEFECIYNSYDKKKLSRYAIVVSVCRVKNKEPLVYVKKIKFGRDIDHECNNEKVI